MIFTIEPLVLILLLSLFLLMIIGFILFNPVVGLIFLCSLLPLESLVGSIPIPIFPILGATIVAGYLLTNVLPSVNFSENVKQIRIEYVVLFLYVLWIILRNPVSAWRFVDVEGRSYSWMFTYIQLAIVYYLGSRLLRGYNLSWLALGLLLGTTLSAIYGLSTIGIGGDLLVNFRLQGAHGDPNNFAAYALCSLALLPAVQKICRNNWQIWTVTLLGVFQIIVILLTMSKTGLMALGFLMLLWLSRYKSISIVRRSLNIGIGVLLILYLIIPLDFWISMYDTITGGILHQEGTMGVRYTYWDAAIQAFKSSPIWGIGVGQFVWFSLKFSAINIGDVVHNAYLTVLAENGIVGLSLFLGWVTIAAYRFWAVSRRGITEDLRVIGFSGFCAFAMLLFMAMTLSIEYTKILWLLAGSSIALTIDNEILIYHTKRAYSGSISQRYDSLDLRGIK